MAEDQLKNKYWNIAFSRRILYLIACVVCFLVISAVYSFVKILLPWTEYKLLDRSVAFTKQEDIVTNTVPLSRALNKLATDIGSQRITLYVESLNSGANISINKDLRLYPASLAKLPLALVIMNKIESKDLSFNDKITIQEADRDNRSGELYKQPVGTILTIKQLLMILLENSDNTAQHMLLRKITPDDMQSLIDATGLDYLLNSDGKMSTKEYSRFYRTLYYSSYLNPANSQMILSWLMHTNFSDFLSRGVPSSVMFAHKYGEDLDNGIYLDSGIIYVPNRPVMLTVMLTGMDRDTATKIMKTISQDVYQYFANYPQK